MDVAGQIGHERQQPGDGIVPDGPAAAVAQEGLLQYDFGVEKVVPGVRRGSPPARREGVDDRTPLGIADTHSIYGTVGRMDVQPQRLMYVEQTRRSLLDAAESHFISAGYRATSLDAIAEAARFTKGALYRHFANKEAVFTAVLERVQREAVEQIALAPAGPALEWPDVMAAVGAYLDITTSERFRRIVLEEAPESSAGRAGERSMNGPRAGSCVSWWSDSPRRTSSSRSTFPSPADSSARSSPKPP